MRKTPDPEFPCQFSVAEDKDVYLVPEMDRVAFLRGKLSYEIGEPWRVAVGFPELTEKLRLLRDAWDDRVIEIMKYYLITGTSDDAVAEAELTAFYHHREGDRFVFHIKGLKKGEIAVAPLTRALYQRIEANLEQRLKNDPFREFCAPPYVCVRRLEQAE